MFYGRVCRQCVVEWMKSVSYLHAGGAEEQAQTRGEINGVVWRARWRRERSVRLQERKARSPALFTRTAPFPRAYMRVRFRQSFNEERQSCEWRGLLFNKSVRRVHAAGAHPAVKPQKSSFPHDRSDLSADIFLKQCTIIKSPWITFSLVRIISYSGTSEPEQGHVRAFTHTGWQKQGKPTL